MADKLDPISHPAIELMNMQEACEYLGCCRQTIHRYIKAGMLASYMLVGKRAFRKLDLDRFINSKRDSALTRYKALVAEEAAQ